MNKFKDIRESALEHWLKATSRRREIDDNLEDTFECSWQLNLVPERNHNSIFCSIGEWNSNITDLLSETSLDELRYDDSTERIVLFRYYSRLLLIVSEIITDFRDFLIYLNDYSATGKNKNAEINNKANNQLSNPSLEFTTGQLLNYINNICKHKIGNKSPKTLKYHSCNHHIDYQFKDDPDFSRINNSLKVKNISNKKHVNNMKIEVPTLFEIVDQLVYGYKKLDSSLNRKGRKRIIRTKLQKFEQELK